MNKERLSSKGVKSVWGKVAMPISSGYCPSCRSYRREFVERGMDTSGLLPHALEKALDLATRMDFAEAAEVASQWGLPLSGSGVQRLTQSYGELAWREGKGHLERLARQALESSEASVKGRRMVIEVDGTYVLEREKGKDGSLEGREVKSMVIYPLNAPKQRVSMSAPVTIDAFRHLAHGLLRQVGVQQEDECLGLGDGAPRVVDLLQELGCESGLLDVYHAAGYLDKVLKELHDFEHERQKERKRWLKGEVDGAQWLQETARKHEIDEDARLSWSEEARNAWDYLSTHAERGALAYPDYKTAGWCIGSGQIEGYNKWAIGERMKGSGMHWSQQGLKHMAFLRAEFASTKPITSFHEIRLKAFSTPATPAPRPLAA